MVEIAGGSRAVEQIHGAPGRLGPGPGEAAVSGICGWVGVADPATLDAMLAAIPHRGDRVDRAFPPGAALGYRSWTGRAGQAAAIVRRGAVTVACAGELAPAAPCPATAILDALPRLARGEPEPLDGSFAAAAWDPEAERLTLLSDPFGLRSLCWVEHRGVCYFATELKQLLAIPGLPVELDPVAIQSYLTFSFVAGGRLPVRGVRRLPPGRVAERRRGAWTERPYVRLRESLDPALEDEGAAAARVDALGRAAVRARLPAAAGGEEVGLYLSGGLDSSTVGRWLLDEGARVRALSLDFGEHSVERAEAESAARSLGLPLAFVDAGAARVAPILSDLAWKLDLPFGDGVTGPHYLLAQAAARAGLTTVWNGEGGDQLFGGWTNKPMILAEVYGDAVPTPAGRAESYLGAYHRFYKLEGELYTEPFAAAVAAEAEGDERQALLVRELGSPDLTTFMGRLRKADIALKGHDNIMPRAERIAGGFGLDLRSPLFDRALAEASFTLPPRDKLQGSCEKGVLKRALAGRLPDEIVWRQKSGMCVPTTDWVLGPLRGAVAELLGPRAVAARGLFRPEYVARLLVGKDRANEIRPRRIGEKLWALVMLELWLRLFIDGRGQRREVL
jgi:asparagine synthase (glutamine-hydrolysing)